MQGVEFELKATTNPLLNLNVKHVFQIPFTGKTPKGDSMTQEWFDKRASIFEKYTLPSLKKQGTGFYVWVTFRPEDATNPTTEKVLGLLKGMKVIATFNGTMFTEDRAVWHNTDLGERLEKSLPSVELFLGRTDFIYETNLDSDDTIHKDFSKYILSEPPRFKGAFFCKNGYAYNTSDRLAEWNNPVSNQNYTIMFPALIYFDAEARLKYLDGFKSHEEIPEKFDAQEMPDNSYCTVIHGDNISTIWTHPFRGQEIYSEEKKFNILTDYFL